MEDRLLSYGIPSITILTMDIENAYHQALDYLYSFVDYSLKHASELARADFNLERMFVLLEALGNPHLACPVIHIAGTKGKGSTAALCAGALTAAGYRTGLYTSPHLQDYVERIQIDARPISHAMLVELIEEIKLSVAVVPKLTTFEITTALGFLYFARQQVEAAVVEVGLGGRLDATNVVTPRVSVITSLSYDHTAVLGSTLALIATEKAGIIKPGVPVVSAPQVDEARKVLERIAAERGCPLTLVGRDVTFAPGEGTLDGQSLTIENCQAQIENPVILRIPLLGAHQLVNAATAYAALQASGLAVPETAIREGFAGTRWPCRFEIARREPPVVLDSAHNLDSFEKLARTLEATFPDRKVILVFGASEDKDVAGMLQALGPQLERVIATRADHPRALEPEKIVATAARIGVRAEAVVPVAVSLARALELAGERGLVLSAGSMFVTAEVRTAWEKISVL
ncbi:MAG: bifunctional folylpolyglutamate synthase/dihydrofolate synthase [Anaerolineales bacterium]|nr:bifunctional folylpolyglutamate synthase/dihydrofolate synthase [Anaerolineales bacterium]